MALRIFQSALSFLLIGAFLWSFAQPVQWNSQNHKESIAAAMEMGQHITATISADHSDSPFSIPTSLVLGLEWELEEESDSKKRNLSQKGLFNSGEQLVHLINGPPCSSRTHFVTRAHYLPLYLLFEVFRL